MKPVISIVLPTYNGSKYICTSIESCLNQQFGDFELIIVNDCSKDDTPAIIESYAARDPRVRVIHNPVNKKLPKTLNTGFDQARGKYHTWTSDDNYYAPDALAIMIQELEKNPGIGFVYADYSIIDESGKVTGKRTFGDINKKFTGFQGSSACFLYKEELYIKNGGYDADVFLAEDYDFFIKSFLNTPVLYLNRYDLYYYREHKTSLTAQHSEKVNEIVKHILERKMPQLEKKLPRNQLALLYRKFAVYNALTRKNRKEFKLYMQKLQRTSLLQAAVTYFYILLKKFD
jgi:glycosyltransferase involved in cell wall biosynthesis